MSSITYAIAKEIYSYKGNTREAYGLVAYADVELDGTATIVASARDVTCDKKQLQNIADKCNEEKVPLGHFDDIVEDFLAK